MAGAHRSVQRASALKSGAPVSSAGCHPPAAPSVSEHGCDRPKTEEPIMKETLTHGNSPPTSLVCDAAAPASKEPLSTTRRSLVMNMLVSTAVTATALPIASPSIAAGSPEPDPIFAALEAWRRAEVALDAMCDVYPREGTAAEMDEMLDRHSDAFRTVMRTRPTTPAGLAALTNWVREEADDMHANKSHWNGKDFCALAASLDDAVRGMSKLEPWTPPLPSAARGADPIFAAIDDCILKQAQSDARYARVKAAYGKAAKHGLDDKSSLEDRNAFVQAEIGQDPDEYTDEAASAFWQAADDLFDIEPTTLAGVVALLRFADDLGDKNKDLVEGNAVKLVRTLLIANLNLAKAARRSVQAA